MQQLTTKLRRTTLGSGLLSDGASPTTIARYLQVQADLWAFAASTLPSLAVTDHGVCALALTAYGNAMALNLDYVGEGAFTQAALEAMYPCCSSLGDLRLCHYGRALQRWTKLFPKSCCTTMAESISNLLIGDPAENFNKV